MKSSTRHYEIMDWQLILLVFEPLRS